MDPLQDYTNPRSAALAFLQGLVQDRNSMLPAALQYVNQMLTAKDMTASHRDGALQLFAALSEDVMGKKSPVSHAQLGQVLAMYVAPLLQAYEPFLRVRALATLTEYCDTDRDDKVPLAVGNNPATDGWLSVFEQVVRLMAKSEELPVRVYAATLMGRLVERAGMRDLVAPHVGIIMQELLNITADIDLESLTAVLERLVEIFPSEVTPFSVQLCH